MLEYNPQPPYNAGTPEAAGEEIVQPLLGLGTPLIEAFMAQTKETATQLGIAG